jgi:hypothetical protein
MDAEEKTTAFWKILEPTRLENSGALPFYQNRDKPPGHSVFEVIAMSNKWNTPGVPHKGWSCVEVYDLRGEGQSAEETVYATCEMCGNEKIRYVHIMEHQGLDGSLKVGCVCAEKMSEDYTGPRRLEAELRSRSERRKKWLGRKWRTSAKGNSFVNVDGNNIVVYPDGWGQGWFTFRINKASGGVIFSPLNYSNMEFAKMAAFDMLYPNKRFPPN